MTKSNHTPLLELHEGEDYIEIYNDDNNDPDVRYTHLVCKFPSKQQRRIAALIVHRVNNWDKLVEALEELLSVSKTFHRPSDELGWQYVIKAEAALAVAKESK